MNLYGPVRVPENIGTGKAKVTISLEGWIEGQVASSEHLVDVVAPPPGPKLVAVTPRLRKQLIHPNKSGNSAIFGVKFSPDGKRIIAGDYPGGVIQVWDAQTGEQLMKIEAMRGYKGSADYFSVSPDWKTVYSYFGTSKSSRVEKDGKKMIKWENDGSVIAWSLETGAQIRTYQHKPPRYIRGLTFAPNHSVFFTYDEPSGIVEGRPSGITTFWDPKSGTYRSLPKGLWSYDLFSPDSKMAVVQASDEDGNCTAFKILDVVTLKEKVSIPLKEKHTADGPFAYSPDGRMLLGSLRILPGEGKWKEADGYLKIWDATSGKELASFSAQEKGYTLAGHAISPDGKTLAITDWSPWPGKKRLYFFDLDNRKLKQRIELGENLSVREPVFSPDGKWLAVSTLYIPPESWRSEQPSEDFEQPRIHLIEVATGKIRETMVAPQGFTSSLCFSPDGRTLAVGGNGRVLLFDMTQPPGEAVGTATREVNSPESTAGRK